MYEESKISSNVSLLLRSAVYNHIKGVESALRLHADVNASGPDLVSPLHIAAEKGYVELAEFLVNVKGIKLDNLTVYENTPLLLSIYHNHYKISYLLLNAGANPNKLVIFDQTPLHVAAFHGRLRLVKELIKFKADVNIVDCFDRSPLYISLISAPSEVITYLLLKAGANPNFKGARRLSLLSLACLGANSMSKIHAIASLIYFGAEVNDIDSKKETPLHKAALNGYTPLISLLVHNGGDIYSKNIWGQMPVDIAKLHKNLGAVRLLEEFDDEQIYAELTLLNLSRRNS